MNNKTSEIIVYSEDIIKNEIIKFLNLFKSINPTLDDEYLTIINGGTINDININGFIQLKDAIYNLMKKKCNNTCSKAGHYIETSKKLKEFNYCTIASGVKMYDFKAIRNKMLEYIPNSEKEGIKFS